MHWEPRAEEQPDLDAAFAEAERAVGEAFARAVKRFGVAPREPQFGTNPNESISRRIKWWPDLGDPYESLSCEVMLLDCSDGPEVSARIAAWRYLGKGVNDSDDLWHSGDIRVGTPGEAAAALREATAEMGRQLATLDLSPYFPSH